MQANLAKIKTYLEQYERGDADGQETVVDILTDLRHFAGIHAVDFDAALETSEQHFNAEQQR